MRKFNNIISSKVEPSVNDLWYTNGELKYFGNNGWQPVTIKTNNPYTLKIDLSLIGTKLEDKVSSALKKVGELIVMSSSGPIIYNRTIDSNENMVYFTNEDMNGQTTRLTFNNANKMLLAVKVPMKKVNAVEVGGISQGKAITDATSSTLLNKFNELLAELRKSGVIAE